MNALPIHHGRPWSPYFVFIKSTDMTDREVLASLGLAAYAGIHSAESRYDYLAIGRDSLWTHVADNFGYTHWHSKDFKDAVSALASKFDIFSFSVGDSEMSFDLHLYRGGSLIRRFIWEDRDYSGGNLREQFGSPLKHEDTIPCGQNPLNGLWQVASALGIEADYTKIDGRLYAPASEISRPLVKGEPLASGNAGICVGLTWSSSARAPEPKR